MTSARPIARLLAVFGRTLACGVVAAWASLAGQGIAEAAPDCERMAEQAGRLAGLPDGLLPAIARIESGRGRGGAVRAWPWTLNHAGKGMYFDTAAETLDYLRNATSGGRTNIDVGCMQINHRWHGENFPSLEAMLNPETNIAYAIVFLKDLRERHGSWAEAVRHYHSPDENRGARYYAAFSRAHARITGGDDGPVAGGDAAAPFGSTVVGGTDGLRLAGLFGTPASGAGRAIVDLGAGNAEQAQPEDIYAIYDALLALGAERHGADFDVSGFVDVVPFDSDKLPRSLRRNWTKIEAFRTEFATR
jgi:hypothetical protein